MAALTAEVHHSHLGTPTKLSLPCVKADDFYAGAIVYLDVSNNTGQVQVDSFAAGDIVVGICAKTVTTTAAADLVEVYIDGVFSLPVASTTATDVGSWCIIDADGTTTDNPAESLVNSVDTTLAANDVLVGQIIGINTEETGQSWVRLSPISMIFRADTGAGDTAWLSPI